jgi:hypothetical protein
MSTLMKSRLPSSLCPFPRGLRPAAVLAIALCVVFAGVLPASKSFADPPARHAAATTRPAAAKTIPAKAVRKAEPGMFYTEQELDAVEKMDMAGKSAFFAKRSQKFQSMTQSELTAYLTDKRKAFEGLPADKQKELNDRTQKLFGDFVATQRVGFEKNAAEEKRREDANMKVFLSSLPDYQRAVMLKYKALRQDHSREYAWHMILEEAGKGAKITPVPEKQ